MAQSMANGSRVLFKDDRSAIYEANALDEGTTVSRLVGEYPFADEASKTDVQNRATKYVNAARAREKERGLLDTFLQEFGLSNQEGVALMCLAEALLRVPDSETADRLIAEKISNGDWTAHKGRSGSSFVNAATWGLMLTGQVVGLDDAVTKDTKSWMKGLVGRVGEPVVRTAIRQAMRIMGGEFVLGRTIEEAIDRDASLSKKAGIPALCSFDMLGEGARTEADAQAYFKTYSDAIKAVAKNGVENPESGHGISVKLSALHARYQESQSERVMQELYPRIRELALQAKAANMHLTIDAEEAARLHLSLDIIRELALDESLQGWNGLGFALQCYSKRAFAVLDWAIALSHSAGRRMMVRLVKGAYWDSEIKYAQEMGLDGYPVFTRKASTDLSYLAIAKHALENRDVLFPQFSTHNAHTIAAVMELVGPDYDEQNPGFEFQRLHGMGTLLFDAIRQQDPIPNVRTYAPVGNHKDLLAYLVRRLLENGANTSFVNRFMDAEVPVSELLADPLDLLREHPSLPHHRIGLPADMFGDSRKNSVGLDIEDRSQAQPFVAAVAEVMSKDWSFGTKSVDQTGAAVTNPTSWSDIVGHCKEATVDDAEHAVTSAVDAQKDWDELGGEKRGSILRAVADALEEDYPALTSLLIREAGKTYADAIAEIREAIDFCRFYADQAEREFEAGTLLPGPTGEENWYTMQGRGVFVCISPWNFPLAIFLGQVTAALAAGNAVIAKPAEQTPLIAAHAVGLLHKHGVPKNVLHFLAGPGETVGAALTADERIAGVAMTGSTQTAKIIARTLADRDGPIIPFIAETGGQNAMFVDSTALPEQVVDDVIRSAFQSAGQRCSALRVLYLQDEIADHVIEMIKGAMDMLCVGDPQHMRTDVGPVIDTEARKNLMAHCTDLTGQGQLLHSVELSDECRNGTFVAPHMFEIKSVNDLTQEHFGPILHVVRYRLQDLDRHLEELKATGYGLTLGIHSRIEGMAAYILNRSLAGNSYINRNMVGAVVGVQPFGGKGLSGTGPKAGGPLYMHRFAAERVRTVNTVATGGNAELLNLG